MEDLTQVLLNSALFCGLSRQAVQDVLLPRGSLRAYPEEAIIILPRERVEWFAVVVSGQVRITQIFLDGCRNLIDTLRPPKILGGDLVFTGSRLSPYYAIASEKVRLFSFPAAILEPGALPEELRLAVWGRLATLVSNENMRKYYHLAVLSQHGLRDRILVYLTLQAGKKGTNTFRVPFSREEMANYLCVNRSALSHELSRMAKEGLISFRKNEFALLQPGWNNSAWTPME